MLPSTLFHLERAGNIHVSVGSCFTRALPARRSRLRRSALFGRSVGAALRAAFGSGQRFALLWGACGAPWMLLFCLDEYPRIAFRSSSRPNLESGSKRPPEDYFGAFQSPARKIAPVGVLGVPSGQNWIQGAPRHRQREAKGCQHGPKEAQREPQMAPRGAQGRQSELPGTEKG